MSLTLNRMDIFYFLSFEKKNKGIKLVPIDLALSTIEIIQKSLGHWIPLSYERNGNQTVIKEAALNSYERNGDSRCLSKRMENSRVFWSLVYDDHQP